MNKKELINKLHELDCKNQELMDEISDTDLIMRKIGFSNGLSTVKAVAAEMVSNKELFDLDE